MIDAFANLLFLMLAGHALADQPLQPDNMRAQKNRKHSTFWRYGLASHALIHGGIVAAITGHWWLGLAEAMLHATIDDLKCMGRIDLKTDQGGHALCKVIWSAVTVWLAI